MMVQIELVLGGYALKKLALLGGKFFSPKSLSI